ncbi:hypothetical protein [Shouchella lonarensis]|uniref:Uncharacterized protein n=1 Tax=Shouchella lonarensis TaxID=1464122 RepID=A0A1G6MLT6_9BACI|nr:hypothetical protein [Shouchella lonarensis]SDC56244.1 hypothetical protein SAMN05421737_11064 [Shouchella lonarensis]
MALLHGLFALVYVCIFFWAVIYTCYFSWGQQGKDERGQAILNRAGSIPLTLLPLSWFLLEITNDHFYEMTFEQYKEAVWLMVTGLYILYAVLIWLFNRRS